ncbi:MAG: hypothetical protein ACKPKO_62455, partial [Candidatus Fonsibacter sp.]
VLPRLALGSSNAQPIQTALRRSGIGWSRTGEKQKTATTQDMESHLPAWHCSTHLTSNASPDRHTIASMLGDTRLRRLGAD